MPEYTQKMFSTGTREELPSSIFRNRNFILLWCAYTTSALGDHLSEMAILHMQGAVDRPDSTRISAIIMFLFMAPFLFGPFMGVLADKWPRKWIMIAADVIRAGLMVGLMAIFTTLFRTFAEPGWREALAADGTFPHMSPWLYALPLLVTGVFAALFSPSRAAMVPTLIRPDQLVRGNGLMNAMGPIATIASFLIGAKLIETYGRDGPRISFLIDASTFVASATLLFFIRPPRQRKIEAASHRQESLSAGFRYCRSHGRVIELIAFTVVFWSASGIVYSVTPALVNQAGGAVPDIGYYRASLGIGMLAGAMLLALLGDSLKSEISISWSLIGAGFSTAWLVAMWMANLGQMAAYVGMFFTGVFGSGILVGANALLQRVVPNCFRGRVLGVKDVISMGGMLIMLGLLSIPPWPNIDRYVPMLLAFVSAVMFTSGVMAVVTRLKRGRFGFVLNFWKNLNDFYCWFWPRTRRLGVCTIPLKGPVIVAANHNSTLDPFVLTACSPNRVPGFMIAIEYARIPLFRYLVESIECVPVTRSGVDTASVKAALRHLKNGKMLGIFPQGGVQRPDEPPKVRDGIGMLALRSGATVIPAHISGIKYSDGVIGPFLRRQKAVVRYGPPVDLSRWAGREHDREAMREVSEHVMDEIMRLQP